MCSIGYSKKRESSYLQMLNENKVEGLIVNTSGYNDDLISALSNHIPIVLSNRKILSEDFVGDFVDSENVGCAYELTKKLLINGQKNRNYQRITSSQYRIRTAPWFLCGNAGSGYYCR